MRTLTSPFARLLAAGALLLGAHVALAAAEEHRIALGSRGAVFVQVPEGWTHQLEQQSDRQPPTLHFKSVSGAKFEVLMTMFAPPPTAPPGFGSDAYLRALVEASAQIAQAQAVESKLELLPLKNGGWYFSATDKAPKVGDYKMTTQGASRIGGLLATFTILTVADQTATVDAALALIQGARYDDSTAVPIYYKDGLIHLVIPGRNWVVTMPSGNWKLADSRRESSGGYYVYFTNEKQRLNASWFVEPAQRCKSSEECREMFWKNPGPAYAKATQVERGEQNGFAWLHCLVPMKADPKDKKEFQQLNYSAHQVRDGYWLDLHLSQAPSDGSNLSAPMSFIDSVNVVELTSGK